MSTPILTRTATPGNGQGQSLDSQRDYLRRLEAIAHHGRTSTDPAEVKAAVWCFAKPSAVLSRLADRSRRCYQ